MEKSIESIWKTGFAAEQNIAAPKVFNLYQRKSGILTEQIKRTYKYDNGALPFLAVGLGIAAYVFGYLWIGVYLTSLLFLLFFLNKQQFAQLTSIKYTDDLYTYLCKYRHTIKSIMKFYNKLMLFGLPLLMIPAMYVTLAVTSPDFWSNLWEHRITHALFLLGFTGALSGGIGILAYQTGIKALYGKKVQRLDELIKDLEELND